MKKEEITSEIIDVKLRTVVAKDQEENASFFVEMINRGTPIFPIYLDGPPILRTSGSRCYLILIESMLVKVKMM